MKKITQAVVATAGLATRFLPATKIIPKPLIPVLNKPVIQYIVEEMINSGIEHIVLIIPENSGTLETYFKSNNFLVSELVKRGKNDYAAIVKNTDAQIKMTFLEQSPLGNGAPILRAEHLLNNEPFLFAFGDDLVLSETPFSASLIKAFYKYNSPIIGVQPAEVEQIMACGAVTLKGNTDEVIEIIEKPSREQIKTNLLEFGRMILTKDIIELLKQTPEGKNGELWLIDALSSYIAQGKKLYAAPVENGKWYTTGDPLNHLRASIAYGLKNPDYSEKVKKVLKEFSSQLD